MMNQINNFLLKKNLFIVFLFYLFSVTVVSYIMSYFILLSLSIKGEKEVESAIIMGFLMGLIMTGLTSMARIANRVYRKFDEYKEKVQSINLVDELRSLRAEVVSYSRKNSFHEHMYSAAREVIASIDTKINTLNKCP